MNDTAAKWRKRWRRSGPDASLAILAVPPPRLWPKAAESVSRQQFRHEYGHGGGQDTNPSDTVGLISQQP